MLAGWCILFIFLFLVLTGPVIRFLDWALNFGDPKNLRKDD